MLKTEETFTSHPTPCLSDVSSENKDFFTFLCFSTFSLASAEGFSCFLIVGLCSKVVGICCLDRSSVSSSEDLHGALMV